MATAKKSTYEAEAIYKVELVRSIKVGPEWINPGSDMVLLKGKHCEANSECIGSAEKVD